MFQRPQAWFWTAVIVAVLGAGALAGNAEAQPSPFGAGAAEPEPRTREEQARAREEAWRAAEETERRETASGMKRPEKLTGRPSGFWTSTRPAKGGSYRWRIMAAGIAVLGITIFFVLRLLRRTTAARSAHST